MFLQQVNRSMNTNEKYNDKNNRSFLALAGQRYLNQQLSSPVIEKDNKNKSEIILKSKVDKEKQSSTRKLMMKLTLPRLRKMQALVRGFLVRRKIYPPKLEQYLLSKSLLNILISNVVYRQVSQILLENITYIKYSPDSQQSLVGYEKVLENQIFNRIVQRVAKKQIQSIIEVTTAQFAKLLTRPKITYGFNLRDPLQLLLFDIINNFVGMNYKEVVRQSIQQCVDENRVMRIIEQWIQNYGMLTSLYQSIINQALSQSMGEYIVDNMINKICIQGVQVCARVCIDEEIQRRKTLSYNQIEKKMVQWILQQAALNSIVQLGHAMGK